MKRPLRRFVRWMHLWLGLIAGAFISLMGLTGGIVGLRPQIATLLSPPAPASGACASPDWNDAARQIAAFAGSEINRVYGPYAPDTRWHFRMATGNPILFKHVIYDACSARVLGSINLAWMDWTVDLHHNLLKGRTGRQWAGAIGIVMLVSGLSGLLLWLLAKPDLRNVFRVSLRFSRRTPIELHRLIGLGAAVLLSLEAFTGLWLCFPQTMRAVLAGIYPIAKDVRPARTPHPDAMPDTQAGLKELMNAAHQTVPDGFVREIRMPEGGGAVQVRMWRPGDFRSLGNNVVYLSSSTARVLAVDRYADKPAGNRIVQAMAGLHYDEWGGLTFRLLSCAAGFATPLLFVTGIFIWWYSLPRPRRKDPRPARTERVAAFTR